MTQVLRGLLAGKSVLLHAVFLAFMPLEPELPITETTRLTNGYAVAFFDAALKHQDRDMALLPPTHCRW
jgi:hypothetical protein